MKNIKIILFLTLFLMGTLVYGNQCKQTSIVTVTGLNGSATKSKDSKSWASIKKDEKIEKAHFVKTSKKSTLMLRFPDGSSLKVGENSMINLKEILSSKKCERESYQIKVFFGKIWSNVKKIFANKGSDSYVIESKNAVAGVRGTSFGFVVDNNGGGTVMVLNGAVEVKGSKKKDKAAPLDIQNWKKNRSRKEVSGPTEITKDEWDSIILNAMQMVKFSSNGKLEKPVPIGAHNAGSWVLENSGK